MAGAAPDDHLDQFELHLGGSVEGLTPQALYVIASQTAALADRMGELADPTRSGSSGLLRFDKGR